MLFFTILKAARKLVFCPTDGKGEMGDDLPSMYVYLYNAEGIVASREGKTHLFHVREIRSESAATVSGYCVEGEDSLI